MVHLLEEKDGVISIALAGRIQTDNAQQIKDAILQLLEGKTYDRLILNAKNLDYLSSSGLRVLLQLQKMQTDKIQIIECNSEVFDIFSMTGFTEIIDVRRSLRIINTEGCKLIGKGANGEVFQLDRETIIKVYMPNTPMSDVQRERDLAQKAFLKGIPTAISYDVCKTQKDRLGIVFELLDAKTLSDVIMEHPERFDELAEEYVNVFKEFHTKIVEKAEFPSLKEIYMGYIDGCKDWYTEEELNLLRKLVLSIPDRKTMIHGDYHAHNIMYVDGELVMIDMGDVGYGHPVFDFLATAASQINLAELNPEFSEIHTGMSVEFIRKLWYRLIDLYFADRNPEEIAEIEQQIRMFSKLKVAIAPVVARGIDPEILQVSVADARTNLLPHIDELIGTLDW